MLEAGLVMALLYFGLWAAGLDSRETVGAGLGLAWVASAAGTAMLAVGMRGAPKAFWAAFGAGMFLRLLFLAGLAGYAWRHPEISAPALLISYAAGIMASLLLEYRRLMT